MSHKRRSEATAACLLRTDYTLQENSSQCGSILHRFQRFGRKLGDTFQKYVFKYKPIQLHGMRTQPSFNFCQSAFRHQAGRQICHYTTGLTSSSVLSDFSISVSVGSTEGFSLSLILFQIHFCIWQKSTSVKKNMKSRLSSPEIDSIGCLLIVRRTDVFVQYQWCDALQLKTEKRVEVSVDGGKCLT